MSFSKFLKIRLAFFPGYDMIVVNYIYIADLFTKHRIRDRDEQNTNRVLHISKNGMKGWRLNGRKQYRAQN